jgi:glycosyltransferase involved in cell wall biosynthesis
MTGASNAVDARRIGRPRIVLVQTQAEGAGAQEISRLLSRELAARGCELHQIFLFRRTASFDADPRARFCATERPRSLAAVLRLLIALRREIRLLRPDVVICFQHWGNLIGALIARLAGVRLIVANQNTAPSMLSRPLRELDRLYGIFGLFSRIVVNSAQTEADYRAYAKPYRRRLVRIDHSFDPKQARLSRAEARAKFGLPIDAVVLGNVGRLHPQKNQSALIRLLPGEPSWHVVLAGQGESEAEYRALARSLGCGDRLHLVGERSPEEIGDLLGALDIFVFPSRAETFGLAVVEAAGAGVPVVANDLPVLREVLSADGEPCAVFVDADDVVALAAAVRGVVADANFSSTLSERGLRLRNRYPLSAMVDGYEALIGGLLRPSGKAIA